MKYKYVPILLLTYYNLLAYLSDIVKYRQLYVDDKKFRYVTHTTLATIQKQRPPTRAAVTLIGSHDDRLDDDREQAAIRCRNVLSHVKFSAYSCH